MSKLVILLLIDYSLGPVVLRTLENLVLVVLTNMRLEMGSSARVPLMSVQGVVGIGVVLGMPTCPGVTEFTSRNAADEFGFLPKTNAIGWVGLAPFLLPMRLNVAKKTSVVPGIPGALTSTALMAVVQLSLLLPMATSRSAARLYVLGSRPFRVGVVVMGLVPLVPRAPRAPALSTLAVFRTLA